MCKVLNQILPYSSMTTPLTLTMSQVRSTHDKLQQSVPGIQNYEERSGAHHVPFPEEVLEEEEKIAKQSFFAFLQSKQCTVV